VTRRRGCSDRSPRSRLRGVKTPNGASKGRVSLKDRLCG
jgi:hypothetical protein